MAAQTIAPLHSAIGLRIAEMHSRAERLSPLDIDARMDAIRQAAVDDASDGFDGLAKHPSQLALGLG